MDKLEFDARLAQLERRVSYLSAVILGFLALVGVGFFFMLSVRAEAIPSPPMVATPITTIAPVAQVTTHQALDFSEGSVPYLANRLHELTELQSKALITGKEYDAKKVQLLGQTTRSVNLKQDLEMVGELHQQKILSDEENTALKAKILGIAK